MPVFLYCFHIFHADGQKLGKSLSRSINKKVLSIQKLLQLFNKTVVYLNSFIPGVRNKVIEKRTAFDIDSEIYSQLDIMNDDPWVPTCLKVKTVNFYLMWERSLEEIQLLRNDAHNVITFIVHEQQLLQSALSNLGGMSRYTIGSKALLYEELSRLTFFSAKAISLFEETSYLCEGSLLNLDDITREIHERQAAVLNIPMMQLDIGNYQGDMDENIDEDIDTEQEVWEDNLLDNDLFDY